MKVKILGSVYLLVSFALFLAACFSIYAGLTPYPENQRIIFTHDQLLIAGGLFIIMAFIMFLTGFGIIRWKKYGWFLGVFLNSLLFIVALNVIFNFPHGLIRMAIASISLYILISSRNLFFPKPIQTPLVYK